MTAVTDPGQLELFPAEPAWMSVIPPYGAEPWPSTPEERAQTRAAWRAFHARDAANLEDLLRIENRHALRSAVERHLETLRRPLTPP